VLSSPSWGEEERKREGRCDCIDQGPISLTIDRALFYLHSEAEVMTCRLFNQRLKTCLTSGPPNRRWQ
jgi:hypothetical protein